MMNIETVFLRSNKMARAKYLNPEQETGTLCHMKPPYISMCLLNWKIIFRDTMFAI